MRFFFSCVVSTLFFTIFTRNVCAAPHGTAHIVDSNTFVFNHRAGRCALCSVGFRRPANARRGHQRTQYVCALSVFFVTFRPLLQKVPVRSHHYLYLQPVSSRGVPLIMFVIIISGMNVFYLRFVMHVVPTACASVSDAKKSARWCRTTRHTSDDISIPAFLSVCV